MKSLFPRSGQVFPQFWDFEEIVEARGEKIFGFLKTPFVPFIALKTTVFIPRFQCQNLFEKGTIGVFKNPKIFPVSLKNRLNNPKLRENLT